jgi:hypothetical protein
MAGAPRGLRPLLICLLGAGLWSPIGLLPMCSPALFAFEPHSKALSPPTAYPILFGTPLPPATGAERYIRGAGTSPEPRPPGGSLARPYMVLCAPEGKEIHLNLPIHPTAENRYSQTSA